MEDGGVGRCLRFKSAANIVVNQPLQSTESRVRLIVDCMDDGYHLGFEEVIAAGLLLAGGDVQWVGSVSTEIMTVDPPVGKPFTGMMIGIYSFADSQRCFTPADFRYARFLQV